jgi:hypothetical protein
VRKLLVKGLETALAGTLLNFWEKDSVNRLSDKQNSVRLRLSQFREIQMPWGIDAEFSNTPLRQASGSAGFRHFLPGIFS